MEFMLVQCMFAVLPDCAKTTPNLCRKLPNLATLSFLGAHLDFFCFQLSLAESLCAVCYYTLD